VAAKRASKSWGRGSRNWGWGWGGGVGNSPHKITIDFHYNITSGNQRIGGSGKYYKNILYKQNNFIKIIIYYKSDLNLKLNN